VTEGVQLAQNVLLVASIQKMEAQRVGLVESRNVFDFGDVNVYTMQ